jgi:putative transposase
MAEAQEKIEAWRLDYNDSRPHQALKELTPSEFAQKCRAKKRSEDVTYAGN